MTNYILETVNLTKEVKHVTLVDDINLKVPEGEVYALLGSNGAGKSTILKMLVGIFKPTRGKILFEENPWRRENLEKIGSLIEFAPLYGNLTALENLQVRCDLLNLPYEDIDEVLKIVDLSDTNKKKSKYFSVGMKQRLGIALALINHPKLLILDEPTNGLDPIGIQEMRDLILSFKAQGITIIISSHILSEVQEIADTIGIVREGRLVYQEKFEKSKDLTELFMENVKEWSVK